MSIEITVFDGAKSIGGSKIHLQADGVGLFLDFGTNFKKYGCYFEEFLTPRAGRGICDFLAMDLVPHLDELYRTDLFAPDVCVDGERSVAVDGLFLSHAHLDHSGNAGLLRLDIPLICSSMTAVVTKAIQDSGRSGFESDVLYSAKRQPGEDEFVLKSDSKLCTARPVQLVDDAGAGVKEYLGELYLATKTLECAAIGPSHGRVGSLPYRTWEVDHSVFGATAAAFETSTGWIVYTGDFRLHGKRGDLTRRFVEEAAALKPSVLIIEGTNIAEPSGVSEETVHENCLRAVEGAAGKLVIADFGPRNVDRLLTFFDIARRTSRRLVITPKDAFLLDKMRLVDARLPELSDPNWSVFHDPKSRRDGWEKHLIARHGGEYVRPQEISGNQSDYILCFSFFDLNDLVDVKPQGGIYIYSTSEAFSEEMEMDVWRLSNWLDRFGIEPVGFGVPDKAEGASGRPCKPSFVSGFHASGHASGDELIEVARAMEPKIVIPVHTEQPHLFRERLGKDCDVILPEEGEAIRL